VSANSTLLQEHIAQQAAFFARRGADLADANSQAIGQLAQQIHLQAIVMTYSDCFWILGVGLMVLLPIVMVLPRRVMPPAPPAPPASATPSPAPRSQAAAGAS
jgi:DHA2 family multidrug resistance protein